MEDSIFKNPALLAYLIKITRQIHPDIQIGKTVIQKLIFILSREIPTDFDYEMYHYGPYSNNLESELRFAEDSDMVEMDWDEDKGYFIEAADGFDKFEKLVTQKEREVIKIIVENYGDFKAKDLAIIATALYLKDKYGFKKEALPLAVHHFKDRYTVRQIERLLQESGITD
ncbi:hypothetical protein MBGDF03_00511 [Thermoplasmatales archaeon SCGC AB-540-F20]|nr:hypothetical protein MBGDF03_00511 [Thermoplasmatales archaeon SCGC AB-540-F20]